MTRTSYRHRAGELDEAEFTAAIASLNRPFTLKPVSELAPFRSFHVHGYVCVRVLVHVRVHACMRGVSL